MLSKGTLTVTSLSSFVGCFLCPHTGLCSSCRWLHLSLTRHWDKAVVISRSQVGWFRLREMLALKSAAWKWQSWGHTWVLAHSLTTYLISSTASCRDRCYQHHWHHWQSATGRAPSISRTSVKLSWIFWELFAGWILQIYSAEVLSVQLWPRLVCLKSGIRVSQMLVSFLADIMAHSAPSLSLGDPGPPLWFSMGLCCPP